MVIFDEKFSCGHYLAPYPEAANPTRVPRHDAGTAPSVDGLVNRRSSSGPTGPSPTNSEQLSSPPTRTAPTGPLRARPGRDDSIDVVMHDGADTGAMAP